MPEPTPRPFEFRVMTGLYNIPTINLYINGEIQRQFMDFPKADSVTTALRVARALEEALAMGLQLGHSVAKEEKPKRTRKVPVAQGEPA